jgi:uncharacterized protein (DUF1499 family)
MKTPVYIALALVLVPVVFLAFKSLTSPAPKIGLVAGKLRPCPNSPNCVVSENDTAVSRVEALPFEGAPDRAWGLLRQTVERNAGSIREDRDGYLWATFTSSIFRFVDDVEFRLDAARGVIHVRSASRAGYSDFGVNRKRVEKLRTAFDAMRAR